MYDRIFSHFPAENTVCIYILANPMYKLNHCISLSWCNSRTLFALAPSSTHPAYKYKYIYIYMVLANPMYKPNHCVSLQLANNRRALFALAPSSTHPRSTWAYGMYPYSNPAATVLFSTVSKLLLNAFLSITLNSFIHISVNFSLRLAITGE